MDMYKITIVAGNHPVVESEVTLSSKPVIGSRLNVTFQPLSFLVKNIRDLFHRTDLTAILTLYENALAYERWVLKNCRFIGYEVTYSGTVLLALDPGHVDYQNLYLEEII